MPDETYVALALREFRRQRDLANRAIEQVPDDHFFKALGDGENSIGIILKHLEGNMRSRWRDFLTTDGEKPDRNRDTEFRLTDGDSRQSIASRWEEGWEILFAALTPLTDGDLERTVTIRGETFTVLQAISRQLVHYAYHVGQLVFLAKHFAGAQWRNLSIPRDESESFNKLPGKYL